jgi:hypothetical protein
LNVVFKYIAVQKLAVKRGGGGRSNASPNHYHPISQLIRRYLNISLIDDVIVILLLGVSFKDDVIIILLLAVSFMVNT